MSPLRSNDDRGASVCDIDQSCPPAQVSLSQSGRMEARRRLTADTTEAPHRLAVSSAGTHNETPSHKRAAEAKNGGNPINNYFASESINFWWTNHL